MNESESEQSTAEETAAAAMAATQAMTQMLMEMSNELQKRMSYLTVKPNRAMRRGSKQAQRGMDGSRGRR